MEEVWKPVVPRNRRLPDGRLVYYVSNLGRVQSIEHRDARGHRRPASILSQFRHKSGSLMVNLRLDGDAVYQAPVARLVAAAFVPNPNGFRGVRFLNGDKDDCRAVNLEWFSDIDVRYDMLVKARDARDYTNARCFGKERKRVRQYDLTCKFIAEYGSVNAAQRTVGITGVSNCCQRKLATSGGFLWRFAEDDELVDVYASNWHPIVLGGFRSADGYFRYEVSRSGEVRVAGFTDKTGVVHAPTTVHSYVGLNGLQYVKLGGLSVSREIAVVELVKSSFISGWIDLDKKPVRQYSLSGRYMNEFKSYEVAGTVVGANPQSILNCCKGLMTSCVNYLWRSVVDDNLYGKTELELRPLVPGVYRQYTADGQLVAEYATKKDAYTAVGRSQPALDQALNKKGRTCGGFVWFHSSKDEFYELQLRRMQSERLERERKRLSFGWK